MKGSQDFLMSKPDFEAYKNKIQIRCATRSDLSKIMQLEQQGFEQGIRESSLTYLKRISLFPDGAIISVFNNTVIGCVFSEIWDSLSDVKPEKFELNHDISDSHKCFGNVLYISSMTIDPSFRGLGFGKILFRKNIEFIMSKYSLLTDSALLVNEQWDNARRIYIDEGFRELFVIKNFFMPSDGVFHNGIVMIKNFNIEKR